MISPNKSTVGTDLISGIKNGRYKNCIHLVVSQYSTYGFHTGCTQNSLDPHNRPIYDTLKHKRVTREPALKCPENCAYFLSRTAALAEQQKQDRWNKAKRPFAWGWSEFKKLHWPVQLGIIGILFLLVLWLVAPGLIPQFIQLIGAIRGS